MKSFFQELNRNKTLFLMIAPALLFFIVFSYVPMVGVYYAFTRFDFAGGLFGSEFIGMKNFEFLFNSGVLWNLTKNTVLYNIAFILISNMLQLLCAIFLSELPGKLFKKTTQSVMFLPFFVSFVLVGAFVFNLFNSDNGVINTVLQQLGMQPYDFYVHTAPWKYIIVFFHVWKGLGYGTVIYLAAIMSISDEYHEAAKIDGANIFQRIRHIIMPMLVPTFILLILLSLGGILKGQFDLFYQIIGNNGMLYNSTDIIDTYVYRSLAVNFDIGMGTAAGLYQSFFGFVLIITVNYIIRKVRSDYALF
ncbi:putative aldouronate transport system permease protein [Paenibacillus cellulosilyticus]|uniref:Putative aldouronate transport system permease protein n=1 Tax=Paenibacillus cellulosilyticus TaxID=375489 RepID=A0A2V2YGZ0_9BACL|nr:ABC transporter permease subunit [Paenibacillus cellulosilyticus]PWV90628.1 putative aldouronate transport system permease protein [Paenibacillus cellulosilyticus]QKS43949.1 sugar ABC transporter permease [Paenibacillus cellulosilyticus]